MIVPDEVVIEALLKDAKRFKSKWELHTSEPTRSKPNVKFLKRTLSNVVKTNQDRMRKPKDVASYERDLSVSSSHRSKPTEIKKSSKSEKYLHSRRDTDSRHCMKKSEHYFKSKCRSPERSKISKKSSKETRNSSSSQSPPKR